MPGRSAAASIFRVKLLIVATALVNAILFRLPGRGIWPDRMAECLLIGRAQAGASLLLWFTAATAGRADRLCTG